MWPWSIYALLDYVILAYVALEYVILEYVGLRESHPWSMCLWSM